MDAVIIICALILNPRAKNRRGRTADISSTEVVSNAPTPTEVDNTSRLR